MLEPPPPPLPEQCSLSPSQVLPLGNKIPPAGLLQLSSGYMPNTLKSEIMYLHTIQHFEKIKSKSGVFTPKLGLWVG